MSTSKIYKSVEPSLLSESNKYSFVLIDNFTKTEKFVGEASVEIKNPFGFNPKEVVPQELLPNLEIFDLERFFTVAQEVVADAQEREGILPERQVQLIEDYQPEDMSALGDEVITFKVVQRYPAKMDSKGTGRSQYGSNYNFNFMDPKQPNKVIIIESRPIDHEIEFSVWAKTATLANKRALWLEKLFHSHRWAFIVQGAERFIWLGRGPDTLWKPGEQRLHQRPLRFRLRLREFEIISHAAIRSFNLNIELSTE